MGRFSKQIYNNLLVLNGEGEVENQLVEKYKVNSDGSIDFELKKGIKFHDGEELSSEIVKNSLERNMSMPTTKVLSEPLDEIIMIDKYNFKIIPKYNTEILLPKSA